MRIAGCSPEPECTVDMEPRTGALEDVGDLSRRVEGAGVHLPELRTDDRRPGGLGECRAELRNVHASLTIGGNLCDCAGPESEQT